MEPSLDEFVNKYYALGGIDRRREEEGAFGKVAIVNNNRESSFEAERRNER